MKQPTTRLAAVAFGVLLLATVGAFVLANQLKSQPPEVEVIRRDTYFSPNGDGRRDTDTVIFTVALTDRAAIDVVDADGVRVRRLAEHKRLRKGRRVRVTWDGHDDDGKTVADGEYRLRLILDEGRSLLAPRPFFVDTVPPEPAVVVDPESPIVQPGTTVPFRVRGAGADTAPSFTVLRTDVSPPRTVDRFEGEIGEESYVWDGRTLTDAVAGPGIYLIAVKAYDKARNEGAGPKLPLSTSPPTPVEGRPGVTIRRLAVQPPVRSVRAGDPVNLRVDARGRAFSWTLRRLGERKPVLHGRKEAGRTNLLLRAPRGPSGIYLLRTESHGADATVPIAVRAQNRVGPLVVLPMITWLGRDGVDQNGDGVPDVFGSGQAVRFPRLFAYPGGPPGLYSELAPLLIELDRQGIRYDLATDLDLDFGNAPSEDQRGVLFAGGATWISRDLAKRLRNYVAAGGRVALFGPDSLRASVTVGNAVLARPSGVTAVDALGGRLGDLRTVDQPLTVLEEDQLLGLLEGFSGLLEGFTQVEELFSPGQGTVVTSVGEETDELRPALSATEQGKGLVIRVGLRGWGERLAAHDDAVTQLTRNIVDLLRGVQPKARTARG